MKTEQGQRKPVAAKSATSLVWRSNGPQVSIPGLPVFLQPKLAISQPGDPSEIEADQIADQIMRMPERAIQRQCAACEEEEVVTVSRKAEGTVAGEAPRSVHATLRSSGQPLASSTRAFFEPRFGQDLSQVRVHTDSEAQQSARDVNALAYTVGAHVVFGADRYAPGTPDGQRLLAHELTHVVQQSGTGLSVPIVSRKQTNWPAWHQDILRDVINMVGATADLDEAVQGRWLLRYLCDLPQERAQSLYARWNRSALALPGNKDDFPVFILANFGAHYDDALTLLEEIGNGTKPGSCALPQPDPEPPPPPGKNPAPSPPAPGGGGGASGKPTDKDDSTVSESNCRVDVRAVAPPVPIGNHLFIVASKENGVEYGYRGGPDVPGGLFALIETDVGRYEEGLFPDWDPAAQSVTVLSGAAACGMAECFSQRCSDIDAAEIGYEFYGPNSNSVVSELLSSCGAPREKPDVWAPGWDVSLFDSD